MLVHFRKRQLAFYLFIFITLGIASPYVSLASELFQVIGCNYCTIKHANCPHCQKQGHLKPKKKQEMACDKHDEKDSEEVITKKQRKKKNSSLNPISCSPTSPFALNDFFQERFFPEMQFTPLRFIAMGDQIYLNQLPMYSTDRPPELRPPSHFFS